MAAQNSEQPFSSGVKPPPPWTDVGRHGVFPEGSLDEAARLDFVASLNQHLAARVFPGNKASYDAEIKPEFERTYRRSPETRQEVRRAMAKSSQYQFWSALRRTYMEMRQEAGRTMVLRQADALLEKAEALNRDAPTLRLDPALPMPAYLTAVDIHCMPGSYHGETKPGDVANPANYDAGIFATTGGLLGRLNDGGGRSILSWLDEHQPDFEPRRILDVGTGLGHNIVPLAARFPEAEIWAIDVAAPMLRYGHARARSMGVESVVFAQMNGEKMDFEDGCFDLVTTAMFWHETSRKALSQIMREIHRVMKPGGLTLHLEQPPYRGMDPFDACIRDWDSHNNNEPFWTTLHDMNMVDELVAAGFAPDQVFETNLPLVIETTFTKTDKDEGKAPGRGAGWYGFGAWKH